MSLRAVGVVLVLLCGCATAERGSSAVADEALESELRGGRFHARGLAALELGEMLEAAAVDLPELAVVTARHVGEPTVWREQTPAGAEVIYMSARQQVGGVPVRGSHLHFAARDDGEARLAVSSFHLYGGELDGTTELDRDGAESIALDSVRQRGLTVRAADLEIEPRDGRLQLVWVVSFDGHYEQVMVDANGETIGRARVIDDRIFDVEGRVRGQVAVGGAPRPGGEIELLGLRGVGISSGPATAASRDDGGFELIGEVGHSVRAWLSGDAGTVVDDGGREAEAMASITDFVDLVIGRADSERELAQVTAYHYVDAVRSFLIANGARAEHLGAPLETRVNLDDSCNAYFSPAARTINFYRSSASCHNTAEASIVAHEYGHFADHQHGGIVDGGLSEGWGDLLACLLLDDPAVGREFFKSAEPALRSCDNDYQFPADGHDEVHALGQAWAGFGWHLRQELIARYGDRDGDARARQLLLPSLFGNAPDIPAAVREVVIRDDDDGDVDNGTPNWDAIAAAAERHGLAFLLRDDDEPPAPIEGFSARPISATALALAWTAPGDDGREGTCAGYQLRWSRSPIDEGSFDSAGELVVPSPLPAGTVHELEAILPPGGPVHLAIRAVDDAGNYASVVAIGPIERPEPELLFRAGAEHGLGDWQASGLWHVTARDASRGDAAFWYGQETTGNYRTGGRTAGTLLSPVIDLTTASGVHLVFDEWVEIEHGRFYDQLAVEARDADNGQVMVVAGKDRSSTGGFQARVVDLTAFSGRRIQLAFRFDSIDNMGNDALGWMVDDVRLLADQGPASPRLVINEVLADPPGGYDANGDGVWSYRDDEMIELVNAGHAPIDLSGATLSDRVQVRVTLPDTLVLEPGQVLVVFGGGQPIALPGAIIVTAGHGLLLNNDGDDIRLRAAGGQLLAELSYGSEAGNDVALVRQTEANPASPLVRHDTVSDKVASPGTRSDGTPF